jgi:arabinose-5-phosphate isomerase
MSLEVARRVLRTEIEAIERLMSRLGAEFGRAVDLLFACRGRVVVSGIGKSGIMARKIAATLASTGTPALYVHAADAAHGDLGMLAAGDALLALSYGGETSEVLELLPVAKRLGVPLIVMTGNPRSSLGVAADVVLDVHVEREAGLENLVPTASTTVMAALGDALAIALLELRGFSEDEFAALHPGGSIGRRLKRVRDLMRKGQAVPRVSPDALLPDVIYEMSRKGLGMTSVVDGHGRLAGIITDGDLRRFMQRHSGAALNMRASECMTPNPATILEDELAAAALRVMEERKITSLLVKNAGGEFTGVLHLHDLWSLQLF